jgi:hypothetical protein
MTVDELIAVPEHDLETIKPTSLALEAGFFVFFLFETS